MNSLKRRYGFIIVPILFFICALGLMIIRCACNGYKSQNVQLERTLLSLRVDDHRGDVCIAIYTRNKLICRYTLPIEYFI